MKNLNELLAGINYVASSNYIDVKINNIAHDSRMVNANSCFVALCGVNRDGVNFVADAIANGAVVIVLDSKSNIVCDKAIMVYVENTRAALAVMSANFYDNPSRRMKMIGVVGTNGKTSCVKIMCRILELLGYNAASIGTLGAEYNNIKCVTGMTTPDPMALQKILRDMVLDGVEYVIMEVSAHAIYLSKTSGIVFDCLLYTNITQDHLDYFLTMERYSAVKLGFFTKENAKHAVINRDDIYSARLIHDTTLDITSYGLSRQSQCFASQIKYKNGLSFNLTGEGNNYIVESQLIGKFNVYNLLGSIGVLRILGVDMDKIVDEIKEVKSINGRCNLVTADNVNYIIDYAHTPDGLQNIIMAAKEMTSNDVVVVFGCGGDRDKLKRPIMGNIAAMLADKVIVTSDNPRSEDVHAIIDEILSGIEDLGGSVIVCPDRRHAIKQAVHTARHGDVVVIAGKGAETTMEINGEMQPFSDIEVLKEILGECCD